LWRTTPPFSLKPSFVKVFRHMSTQRKILIYPGIFMLHNFLKVLTGCRTCMVLYRDFTVKPFCPNLHLILSSPSPVLWIMVKRLN
jgi:hypothetical protein